MRSAKQKLPERHLAMSMSQIKDVIIAQLYAYGAINDKEEVVSLEFGYKNMLGSDEELIPLIIKLKPKDARVRK